MTKNLYAAFLLQKEIFFKREKLQKERGRFFAVSFACVTVVLK
jgi:hypothetical protein